LSTLRHTYEQRRQIVVTLHPSEDGRQAMVTTEVRRGGAVLHLIDTTVAGTDSDRGELTQVLDVFADAVEGACKGIREEAGCSDGAVWSQPSLDD